MHKNPSSYVVIFLLATSVLLTACTKQKPLSPVPDTVASHANLAFTCAKESKHLPPLSEEADQLFHYARWLDKQFGQVQYEDMARYYRIAAAHGHYKANNNLQILVSQGSVDSPNPSKETVMLALQLIDAEIPGGYYDMGRYLEIGYGVGRDHEKSLIYYRKAADLGSPEAQYYVGDKLGAWDAAPAIARQMLQCAADQGHGQAARMLANDFRGGDKNYYEALKTFQKGVVTGDTISAYFLERAFAVSTSPDALYDLALPQDVERSRRYQLIGQLIDYNASKNPKIPDIDEIVPLPPAKLPDWDGTFQWQKEQDAAIPPQKPDEKLVERLAAEKDLDPATGLPIPREPLGTRVKTGQLCPESGTWCHHDHFGQRQVSLAKGEEMPAVALTLPRSFDWMPYVVEELLSSLRWWPTSVEWQTVMWQLVAYPEKKVI